MVESKSTREHISTANEIIFGISCHETQQVIEHLYSAFEMSNLALLSYYYITILVHNDKNLFYYRDLRRL